MAVAPITSPIAAGMDAVDYSPWSAAAQARSALPGILNYVPGAGGLVSIPTVAAPYGGSPLSTIAGPDAGDGGTTAGLPMPDVEGYKYVYPRWTWDGDAGWTETGHETDIDKYEYFPYFPGTMGDRRYKDGRPVEHMLVGLRLIPE